MKRIISLLLILTLITLSFISCEEEADPNKGLEEAQSFKMQDLNGNELNLSDLFGTPIVLNFWASWCPPCKSEMPDFERAYKEYGGEIHFVMVSIDDTVYEAQGFISTQGYTFPVYHDTYGTGAIAYNIESIPQTYFINRDGYVARSHTGMITEEQLISGIELIGK